MFTAERYSEMVDPNDKPKGAKEQYQIAQHNIRAAIRTMSNEPARVETYYYALCAYDAISFSIAQKVKAHHMLDKREKFPSYWQKMRIARAQQLAQSVDVISLSYPA